MHHDKYKFGMSAPIPDSVKGVRRDPVKDPPLPVFHSLFREFTEKKQQQQEEEEKQKLLEEESRSDHVKKCDTASKFTAKSQGGHSVKTTAPSPSAPVRPLKKAPVQRRVEQQRRVRRAQALVDKEIVEPKPAESRLLLWFCLGAIVAALLLFGPFGFCTPSTVSEKPHATLDVGYCVNTEGDDSYTEKIDASTRMDHTMDESEYHAVMSSAFLSSLFLRAGRLRHGCVQDCPRRDGVPPLDVNEGADYLEGEEAGSA
eukprot:6332970-Prymnesium_polylepis.2